MAIDFTLSELEAWTWMERSMMRLSMLATLGRSTDSPLARMFQLADGRG